jgi:hypothetical protein
VAPRGYESVAAASELMYGLRFVTSLKQLDLGSVERVGARDPARPEGLSLNWWSAPLAGLVETVMPLHSVMWLNACLGHASIPAPEKASARADRAASRRRGCSC